MNQLATDSLISDAEGRHDHEALHTVFFLHSLPIPGHVVQQSSGSQSRVSAGHRPPGIYLPCHARPGCSCQLACAAPACSLGQLRRKRSPRMGNLRSKLRQPSQSLHDAYQDFLSPSNSRKTGGCKASRRQDGPLPPDAEKPPRVHPTRPPFTFGRLPIAQHYWLTSRYPGRLALRNIRKNAQQSRPFVHRNTRSVRQTGRSINLRL
jgi:hypothetical protein